MSATVPTLVATKTLTLKIRIDAEALERWKRHAAEDKQTLSEYIRYAVEQYEKDNAGEFESDAPIVIAVPANRRSKRDVATAEAANQVLTVFEEEPRPAMPKEVKWLDL